MTETGMRVLVSSGLGWTPAQLGLMGELQPPGASDLQLLVQDDRQVLGGSGRRADLVVGTGFLRANAVHDFPDLRFVQFTSAGLDRVSLGDLERRRIAYATAGDVYTQPMVEWALLQILRFYKRSEFFAENQRLGRWEKRRDLLEMSGKTAVVVGYGAVGEGIGRVLSGLGVTVLGVSRNPKRVPPPGRYVPLSRLDEVLPEADIIVLSVAHTSETHHLMDARRLKSVKTGSVLLNLSRGGVMDTDALVEAVGRGQFLGVALDVFEEEPLPAGSPLWQLPDVVITPHISFASDRTRERMFDLTLANIRKFFDGQLQSSNDLGY